MKNKEKKVLYKILARKEDCLYYMLLDWKPPMPPRGNTILPKIKFDLEICMKKFSKMMEKKDVKMEVECKGVCGNYVSREKEEPDN